MKPVRWITHILVRGVIASLETASRALNGSSGRFPTLLNPLVFPCFFPA